MPDTKVHNPMNNQAITNNLGSNYERKSVGPIRRSQKRKYENLLFPLCPDVVEKYDRIRQIGRGTFGEVFKAKCKKTGKLVALKKIIMGNEREGFPVTSLREIRILKGLDHENIVKLLEVCRTQATEANGYKSQFHLVFEFCDHDLAGLLANQAVKFTTADIKRILQQLLDGLFFIHHNRIVHRDLKAPNILITKNGVLKLADFGLARTYNIVKNGQNKYTNKVVTLWYRPPELLLGARDYGPPVDMWGVGCIMAEMWTRCPIMQGESEQQQLSLITRLCGSITPATWPKVEQLEYYNTLQLEKNLHRDVRRRLGSFIKDKEALDLIDKLLVLNPSDRIDSDSALNHDFFWHEPLPSNLKVISDLQTSNFEFCTKGQQMNKGQVAPVQAQPPRRPGNGYTDQNFERVF